jgi:hypothetical protein
MCSIRDAIGEVAFAYGNIDTSFGSSGRVWFPGEAYGFDARRVSNIKPERECQTHISALRSLPQGVHLQIHRRCRSVMTLVVERP